MSGAEDTDLPADALPPELAGLVELGEDGSLGFSRAVATPEQAWAVGLGVAGLALAVGLASIFIAFVFGASPELGCMAAMASPFAGLLASATARQRTDRVTASRAGVGGEPWGTVEAVRLQGSARTRSARLLVERPGGELELVRAWWGLAPHREKGWDHDSLRWFAARFADLAGAPLLDELPEIETYQASWKALERRSPEIEDAEEAESIPPEESVTLDGLEIRVPGRLPIFVLGGVTTSYTRATPIRVTPTQLRVGAGSRPIEAILDVEPWFGMVKLGKRRVPVGRIVAVTAHGRWVLAERQIGTCEPGHVLGGARAVRDAVRLAQGKTLDRGTQGDVPEALRAIAETRLPEGSSREPGP